MSKKLWLGTAAGAGFASQHTANKFMVQRRLVGGITTRGPDGRWFIDMTGQHIPKEYASRVLGSPEAIKAATRGRPWENNDHDPDEMSQVLESIETLRTELAAQREAISSQPQPQPEPFQPELILDVGEDKPQPAKKGSRKGSKKSRPAASATPSEDAMHNPMIPYARLDGTLDADKLAADFDVKTIESLLSDTTLSPEEKESLREVRAGLLAAEQYQKIQDTASNKDSWQQQSQMKADSRSYDAYNKRIGTSLSPLEALQQQFRNQMDMDAQAQYDSVLQGHTEASRQEGNIRLARWRQDQADEARTASQQAREAQTISNQENNIGLARWRQDQSDEAKQVKFYQSEEERLADYFQNPSHESVMDVLRGKIISKSSRTNQESIQRLIQGLSAGATSSVDSPKISAHENNIGLAMWRQNQAAEAKEEAAAIRAEETTEDQVNNIGLAKWRQKQMEEYDQLLKAQGVSRSSIDSEEAMHQLVAGMNNLSEEVEDNTEQLEEANDDSGDKGGRGKKKTEEGDDKSSGNILSGVLAALKPVMLVLETIGAIGFAAANNAKRELLGSNAAGLSREHYAGLINKVGLGTEVGGALVANASSSVITALRNPDSIASSLEQALTANALLGGPQLDAAGIVKAQLSGDTAGLMNIMKQYHKNATPMQSAAVAGVYGQAASRLSEAEGFSQGDTARRNGVDEGMWRGLEKFNLAVTNVLGGDFPTALGQVKEATYHVKDSMEILADETARAAEGMTLFMTSIFSGLDQPSINDKVEQYSDLSYSDAVRAALGDGASYETSQSDDEEGGIPQEDGGHLDPKTGLINYAFEAERNQQHLLRATDNRSTPQKVEVVAQVAVQGHMTTDDGRSVGLQEVGKEVKVSGAGGYA